MNQNSDRELEGIRPEDVQAIPKENLEKIFNEVAGVITPPTQEDSDPTIELYDSEIQEATKILMGLQQKYSGRPGSFDNLTSLRKEATDRFGKIGLEVTVDWVLAGLSTTPQPPVINIVGRTKEFEMDRQRYEVRKGVAEDLWKKK